MCALARDRNLKDIQLSPLNIILHELQIYLQLHICHFGVSKLILWGVEESLEKAGRFAHGKSCRSKEVLAIVAVVAVPSSNKSSRASNATARFPSILFLKLMNRLIPEKHIRHILCVVASSSNLSGLSTRSKYSSLHKRKTSLAESVFKSLPILVFPAIFLPHPKHTTHSDVMFSYDPLPSHAHFVVAIL